MENGGNMFPGTQGQTGNTNMNLAWDIRGLNPTTTTSRRFEWGGTDNINAFNLYAATTSSSAAAVARAEIVSSPSSTLPELNNSAPSLTFLPHHVNATLAHHLNQGHSIYTGGGSRMLPDPHLVCLKLGKRHYFEDSASLTERHLVGGGFSIGKKGKPYYNNIGDGGVSGGVEPSSSSIAVMGSPATVPRCQVEGCDVVLVNAKEYHRRHKVCEMHSKAPKVVVLGLEQRFCQQCSRFHVVSEFDDSKRSCRRRLAGHNQRRRKTSHDSSSRSSAQETELMTGRFPYHLSSPKGRALSLLSSAPDSWISPSDLSSRSSAALRELIAENRAAVLARQLILDRDWNMQHHGMGDLGEAHIGSGSTAVQQHPLLPQGWDKFQETGAELTLNLMQASSSASGMFSVKNKTEEEEDEEECSELWNSLEGTHVI
ncbi:hypothetical protein HRI_003497000 [Hibiscus trionum]|uniref:SBP-type domain-containing protein n=1 Tax=Hibiscus trionum TaxID=183268 RepID=A0A9W7IKF6_HIBTR|nr:hypothetical protein HRI_003497000 [Hibiscus trionum]